MRADHTGLHRRSVLVASVLVAASSMPPPAGAKLAQLPSDDALEEKLIDLLQLYGGPAGSRLTPSQAQRAEALTAALEASGGGSQHLASEGIGSWGPWIGAWDVLFTAPSDFPGGPIALSTATERQPEGRLELVSARQFVFGPSDAASDLRGIGRDGGISTELTYALQPLSVDGGQQLLLARSGSFTKLPDYSYRLDFAQPARRVLLPLAVADAGTSSGAMAKPLDIDTRRMLGPAGGASLRDITYLSEKLWVSRSNDGGGLLVLKRTDARAVAPPAERPDLMATCAEAVFVRGKVCRDRPLF